LSPLANNWRPNIHGADFKRWRKSLDFSQKEAAEALGLKRRVVQYYEKGERDGKSIDIPKTVRLACYALTQGTEDYDGPADGHRGKKRHKDKDKGKGGKHKGKGKKHHKDAKDGKAPKAEPELVTAEGGPEKVEKPEKKKARK